MAPLDAGKAQTQMVNDKCNKMIKMVRIANLPITETWIAYKTIIVPTVTHGLASTEMDTNKPRKS
jgi:hypothetical protein